jgi:Tfp pilus assembly protein PilF
MSNIEKLQELLTSNETDCFIWHALGLEYLKINDEKQGLACFEKVLAIDKQYLGTYYHIGKLEQSIGNTAKAVSYFEQGIIIATQQKNQHAKNELQQALDDLEDGDY